MGGVWWLDEGVGPDSPQVFSPPVTVRSLISLSDREMAHFSGYMLFSGASLGPNFLLAFYLHAPFDGKLMSM